MAKKVGNEVRGEAPTKIPTIWPGSFMLIFSCRLFYSQQKHSRLHFKIKEAKIKTEECVCRCHDKTNIKQLQLRAIIFF
jgi:hypothetical protein